jgi:signal transduction histidine kinase
MVRFFLVAVVWCCLSLQAAESANLDSLRRIIQLDTALGGVASPGTVKALNDYAMLLHETFPDSTRALATQALALADSLRDWKGKAQSLNAIGVSYFIQNNYEKALEYYLQALALREKVSDMQGVAGTLNNVGMVYRDMKEYSTALTYYFRAMRINDSLKNTPYFVRNLNNIGVAYESMNSLDSALLYHRRSIELKQGIGDKAGIASSLRNIGKVYLRMKRYGEALETFREGLAMGEAGKQVRALILIDIAQVYEETEQYTPSVNNANAAMLLGRELGSALILQNAHELLARLYQRIGDHKSALDNYQRFIAIRDSLFNDKSTRRLAALQTNYELDRQRIQIELLTKEKSLQSIVRNGLVGGFILAVGLLVAIGVAYRNKRRSEKDLRATNAEILRQQELLEHQAQEIQVSNTALSERNLELGAANERLTALNTEKDEIMSIVAHDLKNPIAALSGFTDILREEGLAASDRNAILEQLSMLGNRMLELVKNVLDSYRMESGGIELHPVSLDIAPVVAMTVEMYRERAAAKDITLHWSHPEGEFIACVDEQVFNQVLDNLLSNAVKYSLLGKSVFVRVGRSDSTVRVEIKDEGPGLSDEDMKKLFGKFARLSARPTGGEHSTGLGLSIVKKMVEAMNGTVWCESELGKGATFIVELPKTV